MQQMTSQTSLKTILLGDWFADDFADFWTDDDVGGAFEYFGNAIGGIFGKSMLHIVKPKSMTDSASTQMS